MPHSAPATRTANPDVSVAKSFNVPGTGTTRRRLPPLRLMHRTYAPNDLLKKITVARHRPRPGPAIRSL